MALTTSGATHLYTNYETLPYTNTLLRSGKNCMREAKNLIAKKKLKKAHMILKLTKKMLYPVHVTNCLRKQVITADFPGIPTPVMNSCYSYQQNYNCSIAFNGWNPMNTPLFTIQPIPVIIPKPSPIYAPQIYPILGTVLQPIVSPIPPQILVQNNVGNYVNEFNVDLEPVESATVITKDHIKKTNTAELKTTTVPNYYEGKLRVDNVKTPSVPLEFYLQLPKELFPTAKMLALDPNPVIDEFCKMPNLHRHIPWLLDLEFGIPKTLITRPIPTYNVKFNSIHCKNAPDAVHPGFESCDPEFKKTLLFYYDCIVSAWYIGYMIVNCDRSVENFQSWLLRPMQVLGMCWT